MTEAVVRVEEFIFEDLLLGDRSRMPERTQSLIESGVIDSTGVLELIEFLQDEFGISIADSETIPDNLDSIERIVEFVARKQGRPSTATAVR